MRPLGPIISTCDEAAELGSSDDVNGALDSQLPVRIGARGFQSPGHTTGGGERQWREQSCTVYFAIAPGDRLGKHVDTAEKTQYILSGSGDLLTDNGAQQIKPGDVFVLTEGTSHDLHNTGSEDLRIVAFFSKPEVEQHWDVDTWPPDDTRVTSSPNRS